MAATINSEGQLAGQVAVITGASRGIGAAIAYRYAQEGARVVVSARTLHDGDHVLEGGINNVASIIKEAGGSALAVQSSMHHSQPLPAEASPLPVCAAKATASKASCNPQPGTSQVRASTDFDDDCIDQL